MRLTLSVQYAAAHRDAPRKKTIVRWARAALRGIRAKHVALAVRIVGRNEAAVLNKRYRGKPGATNVLSFDGPEIQGRHPNILGDIVICAPVVKDEARAQKKPEMAHWAHIVVHGIMHLRGHDHAMPRQAAIMERLETRILKRLGYSDPYS